MAMSTQLRIQYGVEVIRDNWSTTASVLDEVRSGFEAGLADGSLADAKSWSQELAGGVAFQVNAKPPCVKICTVLTDMDPRPTSHSNRGKIPT
jgi:hypothetical protein